MRLQGLLWAAAVLLNFMPGAEGAKLEPPAAVDKVQGSAPDTWSLINHADLARYLIHESDYAVTATQSSLQPGWPFGNVLSMSDGPKNESTGRILFYVATQSVFVADVRQDARVSLTVTQEQTPKGCEFEDPEWPLCARATVIGHAWEVGPKEKGEAARLMFARHPQMRVWAHLAHKWAFYELAISHVEILDFFGGFHTVNRTDYFHAKPRAPLLLEGLQA